MNSELIRQKLSHMNPSSFSEREQQVYRAEKMILRQFILLKLQSPVYISIQDMKRWLRRGRSFNREFQKLAEGVTGRELLMVELVWSSTRRLCVDQMEREIREELETETRLSQLLRRKVTLQGLQMFLPIVRSRAVQDVKVLLLHLTNKLLVSLEVDTGTHYKRALIMKLQRWTQPLAPWVVQTALDFLLDDPDPHVEVMTPQSQGDIEIIDSDLRTRMGASTALIGRQLADAAASCFCLQTCFFKDRLLSFWTLESRSIVTAVYRRLTKCSRNFHLLDFDEGFFTARASVLMVINHMMEDRQQRAARIQKELPPIPEEDRETPEVQHEAAGKRQTGGGKAFFTRIWKRMTHKPSEQ